MIFFVFVPREISPRSCSSLPTQLGAHSKLETCQLLHSRIHFKISQACIHTKNFLLLFALFCCCASKLFELDGGVFKENVAKKSTEFELFRGTWCEIFFGVRAFTSVGAYGLQKYGRVSWQLMSFKLYVQHWFSVSWCLEGFNLLTVSRAVADLTNAPLWGENEIKPERSQVRLPSEGIFLVSISSQQFFSVLTVRCEIPFVLLVSVLNRN